MPTKLIRPSSLAPGRCQVVILGSGGGRFGVEKSFPLYFPDMNEYL